MIPPITHPLGRGWQQPDLSEIRFDGQVAVMSRAAFEKLHSYSTSLPSGVYEGKMWKRLDSHGWFLGWYGFGKHPERCSINWNPICVTDPVKS